MTDVAQIDSFMYLFFALSAFFVDNQMPFLNRHCAG